MRWDLALFVAVTTAASGCVGALHFEYIGDRDGLVARGAGAGMRLNDIDIRHNHCRWRGRAPFCNGECSPGECQVQRSRCGNGQCCTTGGKRLCCRPAEWAAGVADHDDDNQPALADSSVAGIGSPAAGPADDGVNDPPDSEYCGHGKIISCPPGATKNEDCQCIPRDKLRAHDDL